MCVCVWLAWRGVFDADAGVKSKRHPSTDVATPFSSETLTSLPTPLPQLPFTRSNMAAAACARAPDTPPPGQAMATFAGGCFWGLELAFQRVPGVTTTSVGYTGGPDPAPTYETVCSGTTGHTEAVQVYYDPSACDFTDLLAVFFAKVDPTTLNRQGNDVGTQYRSGIYYHDEEQKAAAENVREKTGEGSEVCSQDARTRTNHAHPSSSPPTLSTGHRRRQRQAGVQPVPPRAGDQGGDRVEAGGALLFGGSLPPAVPVAGGAVWAAPELG